MPDREWLPHDYVDELVPPARPTPSAWIERLDDGFIVLASAWGDEPGMALDDGDTISFDWTEELGTGVIEFDPDGGWALVEGAEPSSVPDDADFCVCAGDEPETVSGSLDDFCKSYFYDRAHTGRVDVIFYCWSKEPVSFVFRAGAFHPADETPVS